MQKNERGQIIRFEIGDIVTIGEDTFELGPQSTGALNDAIKRGGEFGPEAFVNLRYKDRKPGQLEFKDVSLPEFFQVYPPAPIQ